MIEVKFPSELSNGLEWNVRLDTRFFVEQETRLEIQYSNWRLDLKWMWSKLKNYCFIQAIALYTHAFNETRRFATV